jgi:hypothetical protein
MRVDNSASDLQPQEEPSDMEEQPQDEASSSSEEEMVSEAEGSVSGEAVWAALCSSDEEDDKIAKFAKNQTEQVMLRQLVARYKAETPEEAVRMCETIEGATEVSIRAILAAIASHVYKLAGISKTPLCNERNSIFSTPKGGAAPLQHCWLVQHSGLWPQLRSVFQLCWKTDCLLLPNCLVHWKGHLMLEGPSC